MNEMDRIRYGGGAGSRCSPQAANAVLVEKFFVRYEDEVARSGLGDEHPVKGVAVWAGQSSGADGVGHGYRQFCEALRRYCPGYVPGQSFRAR